jgi:pimeloyl-ACP methyl ester carboxylesterase
MSDLGRFFRGVRLLFRALRPRYDDILLPELRHTPEGFEYHSYYPKGKAIRTVMLVYGMTIDGENDARLLKFSRSCVDAGLSVIVPHLPGLMEFLVASGDMRRLESIMNNLKLESEEKIGLVGFSTGGSYALLLASQPALGEMIGPLLLFSPIYDARDVAERLHAPIDHVPQTTKDWDQFYWAQYVIAFRNRTLLELSEAVQEALQIFLADYGNFALDVKRVFYENHIRRLNIAEHRDLFNERDVLDLLSARGHLAAVKSPVYILHDASDQVVPPDHSREMYAELARRGKGFRQEVLITPWLSHVMMQTSGSPDELFQIIAFMSELFRNTLQ